MITYEQVEKARTEIKEMELKSEIMKRDYRIQSVDRVLSFIRTQNKESRVCDIDNLLCHCQNKLLGNIDGIELSLRSDTE